jgi:hypothetical protein
MQNEISSYHEIMSPRVTVFARLAKISDGVNATNTICNKVSLFRNFLLNVDITYKVDIGMKSIVPY